VVSLDSWPSSILKRDDFPFPLRPRSPILSPCSTMSSALENRDLVPKESERFLNEQRIKDCSWRKRVAISCINIQHLYSLLGTSSKYYDFNKVSPEVI
jgi:hypothetical protein